MTGQEAYEQALQLLGYAGTGDEQEAARRLTRSLAVVNQIYADLYVLEGADSPFQPLVSLPETLKLAAKTGYDVLPYGIAMLCAQNEGDGDQQALFAALYNRKRAGVPRAAAKRIDTLPCAAL